MTTFVLFSFTTSLYRFFLVFRLHVIFRSFIFVHMNQFFRYNHSRFNNHYSFINSGARRARGAQRSQYLWILVVVIITHQAKKIYDLITYQLHCGLKSSHQSQYTIHNTQPQFARKLGCKVMECGTSNEIQERKTKNSRKQNEKQSENLCIW